MRKTRIKSKSLKKVLRDRVGKLMLEILRLERGNVCEICRRRRPDLGKFHILPVGRYPRLEFNFSNVLLACWHPCHYVWHHDYFKAHSIEKRIKELRGDDYREKLVLADLSAPKITEQMLDMLFRVFQMERSRLDALR